MKRQPKWLRQAIREADEAYIRQDDICNHIMADQIKDGKFASFELHPDFDKWVRATILTERANAHAERMNSRWNSLTPDQQYREVHNES